jgi:hypothetical protein
MPSIRLRTAHVPSALNDEFPLQFELAQEPVLVFRAWDH